MIYTAGALAAVATSGCGGSDAPSATPDFATVKRVAEATRPLTDCPGKIEDGEQNRSASPGQVKLAPGSRVVLCEGGRPANAVRYFLYTSVAERDKAIDQQMLDYGASPFFVNDRLVVAVNIPERRPEPSPLAEMIRRECGCGEVRPAGKKFR